MNKNKITFSQETKIEDINWKKHDVDYVFECTGKFNSKEKLLAHIENGAKKVIVSAPCKNADKTIVFGVNENIITKEDKIISAASCTTNCLATVTRISDEQFEEALVRHEKAFDKELEEIKTDEKELRKMILKIKKSIIEQSRQNNSTYNYAVNAIEDVRTLNRKVESFQHSVDELSQRVEQCTETFAKAIGVIQQYESNRKKLSY